MRVSSFQLYNNIIRSIQDNMEKLSLEGQRLSSGKKINRPSDDPIGYGKALSYRLDIGDFEQYKKNQQDASSYLEATDTALEGLTNALTRARELSVSAANDTLSADDRLSISKEVEQLRSHILGLANTKYRDRYIFSGLLYDKPAFDSSGNYQGDTNYIEVNVNPDLRVKENITGLEGFAFTLDEHEVVEMADGRYVHYVPAKLIDPSLPETRVYIAIADTDDKAYIESELKNWPVSSAVDDAFYFDNTIEMMDKLKDALTNNNTDRVSALIHTIDYAIDQVSESRAEVGARMNLIEKEQDAVSEQVLSLQKTLSEIEDADITEVVSNMAKYQTALEALRNSGARFMTQSLLDFLR